MKTAEKEINMHGPLVSVVIPVYNAEKYLERCISSVIHQSYPYIEMILVDDGSEDHSSAVIRSAMKEYNAVGLFQLNSGAAVARNTGMNAATGQYVFFLDADDYLEPDIISEMVSAAQKKDAELVICGYRMVEERNGVLTESAHVLPGIYERLEHEEWAYRICATCCRLYSLPFLRDCRIRFTTEKKVSGEDVPFSMSANLMAKNICILPKIGYNYFQHSDSAMHTFYGLSDRDLPYRGLEEMLHLSKERKPENSLEYFYFGVLKFLAQCRFSLAFRASREKKKQLLDFIHSCVGENKKTYRKAFRFVLSRKADFPLHYYVLIWMILQFS